MQFLRVSATCVLLFLMSSPLRGQQGSRADLTRLKSEIRKLQQTLDAVRGQKQSAEQDLRAIDLELAIRARELEVAIRARQDADREQSRVSNEIRRIGPAYERQKQSLEIRLAALYRMGELSYVRLLLSMDRSQNPLQAVSMLSYLVTRDARTVRQFREQSVRLGRKRRELAARRVIADNAATTVTRRQIAMQQARRQKEILVSGLRSQSESSSRRLAELQEKADRLERLVGLLAERRVPSAAAENILKVKGVLDWPALGPLLQRFGRVRDPAFGTYTSNNGIKISAKSGTGVHAIFHGTVLYSSWFKGYGNLVIIDHGNHIFSLYGNVRAASVRAGDVVRLRQLIALVSENRDENLSYLYFEVREQNSPSDPLRWLR